jgi:L-seryl-tRNA(Ser) seleniumtransferase
VVVNNNAAATMLVLAALAAGREAIVSRGELVEIGGGFRVPDVMAQSGATLREVGTTNKTRASDYGAAINERTGLILRVHPSNFRIEGFTERPTLTDLVTLGKKFSIPVAEDLGSGNLRAGSDGGQTGVRQGSDPLATEPSVPASVAAGVDVCCFSGDKLLGGPQAGIVVGRAELVERLRSHALQRALRADKLTLAALEGTLALYLDPERARREIPVLRMLAEPAGGVRRRAERLCEAVGGELEQTVARVGGGALPLAELESWACAVEESLAAPLRAGKPPVVGVVRDGRLLLDCRTLTDPEVDEIAAAVAAARR